MEEDEEEEEEKVDTNLYEWYDDLFAPIADLVHRQDIIIIPEGKDFMVPFCALCDNNDKFLSETFRIRLIPSLTALRMIQDSPEDYHSATGALIVGNPSVPHKQSCYHYQQQEEKHWKLQSCWVCRLL